MKIADNRALVAKKKLYNQPQVLVAQFASTVALLAGSAPGPDAHMGNGGGEDPEAGRAPLRLF